MHNQAIINQPSFTGRDWRASVAKLGRTFAERAEVHDQAGEFVFDNYRDLRTAKMFSAGIPSELGGGAADYDEVADVIRELGRHCASTALVFAMHMHPVLLNVFKYRLGDQGAANTLRKLADGELVIATTGAGDWLGSSGTAREVDGGYSVCARKRFVSGAPGADLLVTSTTFESGGKREVLHFAIPLTADGVQVQNNWNTLGMRATGSNDVVLNDVFVPAAAIVGRRPAGVWHPLWEIIIPTALPLITAAYVGLAESAAELAIDAARRSNEDRASTVGEMSNELTIARLAFAEMVRRNDNLGFDPSVTLAGDMLSSKTIATNAAKRVVDFAAELVGGAAFFRGHALERMLRDVRASSFHPLPPRRQQAFCGRLALGRDPIEVET